MITKAELINPPVVVPEGVRLTMTYREAQVLCRLCQRVGGKSSGSRGAIDRIDGALSTAGVVDIGDDYIPANGCITFTDF